jgi:hypothetical protein
LGSTVVRDPQVNAPVPHAATSTQQTGTMLSAVAMTGAPPAPTAPDAKDAGLTPVMCPHAGLTLVPDAYLTTVEAAMLGTMLEELRSQIYAMRFGLVLPVEAETRAECRSDHRGGRNARLHAGRREVTERCRIEPVIEPCSRHGGRDPGTHCGFGYFLWPRSRQK